LWKLSLNLQKWLYAIEILTRALETIAMEVGGQKLHGNEVLRRYQDESASLREMLK
ncbi:hypothetical protein KI387_027612, partial [Taxus chinensis]